MHTSGALGEDYTLRVLSSTIEKPIGRMIRDEVRWIVGLPVNTIVQAIDGREVVPRSGQHLDREIGHSQPDHGSDVEAPSSRKSHLKRMIIRAVLNER